MLKYEGTKDQCDGEMITDFRAKVKHSDTGRETWQTWRLCGKHMARFEKEKGKGWYRWYATKEKKCHLIKYEEPMLLS